MQASKSSVIKFDKNEKFNCTYFDGKIEKLFLENIKRNFSLEMDKRIRNYFFQKLYIFFGL